ncbi:histidine phosphatase family protein [Sphingomonas sp.]|uniref:SixA phosphatase family protein n=1 Tax=Sphingomonas sp. TaxID=28214 RepID=UPI0035BC4347
MKTLTLLRHAKSGWDDMNLRDFDRRLNPKGKRAATVMGRHMRDANLAFDRVVASPAVRVVETLDGVASGYGRTLAPVWDKRLYLAAASTLLDVVHELAPEHDRVLLVGHNPGLEDLVLLLAADAGEAADKYPTATLAELTIGDAWTDASEGKAELVRFVRPRDLDPVLGPDEE